MGGEEREGKTGRGRGGRAREEIPNILLYPPSSSFLQICLAPAVGDARNTNSRGHTNCNGRDIPRPPW